MSSTHQPLPSVAPGQPVWSAPPTPPFGNPAPMPMPGWGAPPAVPPTPAITPRERAELDECRARVRFLEAREAAAIDGVLSTLRNTCMGVMWDRETAREFVLHAEAIRDALAPFDSGTRPKDTTA